MIIIDVLLLIQIGLLLTLAIAVAMLADHLVELAAVVRALETRRRTPWLKVESESPPALHQARREAQRPT